MSQETHVHRESAEGDAGEEKPGGLLGFLGGVFGGGRVDGRGGSWPVPRVMPNHHFTSEAERNFFHALRRVVGGRGHVLAEVSLRRLLHFPGSHHGDRARAWWVNRAAHRTVPFVVCDPETLRPLVVIELQDAAHARNGRPRGDEITRILLDAAGLPRLCILTARAYDSAELQSALAPHLPPTHPTPPPPPPT